MVGWVKRHPLPVAFLVAVVVGLVFMSAAAYTVSLGLGLLVTGALVLAGAHWLTYLHVNAGGAR